MAPDTGQREVEILLPLAAGLILVALPYVVSVSTVTVVMDVVLLLVLGTVLPRNPWQTGAIAMLPTVVGAVLRAAGDSLAVFGLVVLASPLAVAIAGLVVKAGAVFIRSANKDQEGQLGEDGEQSEARGWRPFETKVQRGRFLIIVAVLFFIGSSFLSNWGAKEADRMAAQRASEIRTALAGRRPDSLQVEGISGVAEGRPGLPGGPYQTAALGTETFRATAEVGHRLQYRCIHVQLGGDGQAETEIKQGRC